MRAGRAGADDEVGVPEGMESKSRRIDSLPSQRSVAGFQVISPITTHQLKLSRDNLPFFLSTGPRCLISPAAFLGLLLETLPPVDFFLFSVSAEGMTAFGGGTADLP